MVTEFRLPELGENIESGDLVKVLVSVGDTVPKDQPKDPLKEMTDGSAQRPGTLSRSARLNLRQLRRSCRRRLPCAGARASSASTSARYPGQVQGAGFPSRTSPTTLARLSAAPGPRVPPVCLPWLPCPISPGGERSSASRCRTCAVRPPST